MPTLTLVHMYVWKDSLIPFTTRKRCWHTPISQCIINNAFFQHNILCSYVRLLTFLTLIQLTLFRKKLFRNREDGVGERGKGWSCDIFGGEMWECWSGFRLWLRFIVVVWSVHRAASRPPNTTSLNFPSICHVIHLPLAFPPLTNCIPHPRGIYSGTIFIKKHWFFSNIPAPDFLRNFCV